MAFKSKPKPAMRVHEMDDGGFVVQEKRSGRYRDVTMKCKTRKTAEQRMSIRRKELAKEREQHIVNQVMSKPWGSVVTLLILLSGCASPPHEPTLEDRVAEIEETCDEDPNCSRTDH